MSGDTTVQQTYKEAARGYWIGFACAFFMAASVAAFLIMWRPHIPNNVYVTAVPYFVIMSFAGSLTIAVAYLWPIRFYELVEGEYKEKHRSPDGNYATLGPEIEREAELEQEAELELELERELELEQELECE